NDNSRLEERMDERDFIQTIPSLSSFYRLLTEKSKDPRIIQKIRDNFKYIVKDFMKYYYLAKESPAEKGSKESLLDKLKFENELLKKNNEKLIELSNQR